jgi:phosphatidate cytidylyltransferase
MITTVFKPSIDMALGEVAIGLGSLVYCALTLGVLILMQRPAILLLFAIIWVGDSAAYYGGRALGRHLLAPRVSPKKTVEGAVAGLLGSVIVGVIGGKWALDQEWTRLIVLSALTAVAGQVGDLAESVLKRSAGVKDSSSILPGHGGILDRLDSLFFAAPVFYWLLNA